MVKQDKDDYKLYDGQHEAIIDEDTWYRAQVKRAKNAFKREKTHSLMHEHILSGLLRCPVCGAPMYGVVNRKKKKGSDEFYTDMWYYICKNRKMVSGHLCDYKKHIRQDEVNTEIMQILKFTIDNSELKDMFEEKMGSRSNMDDLQAEKERIEKEREKLFAKKEKQLRRINDLDIDDDLYDDLMKSYRAHLSEINEQIANTDNLLYNVEMKIDNAQGVNLSAEVYKRIAEEFIQNIDSLTDEQKKILAKMMIEKIEIFTEKQEDGRWVKSVQFKIPMKIGDEIVDTLEIEPLEAYEQGDDDSLSNEEHVETVCLLSKLNVNHHIEVELNLDELDLTDVEKKATYEEIKAYILENTGLKVSNLYIAQVKQKYGIIERENYNKPKSENARQPQCPPEKENAIKDALKHFAMI